LKVEDRVDQGQYYAMIVSILQVGHLKLMLKQSLFKVCKAHTH